LYDGPPYLTADIKLSKRGTSQASCKLLDLEDGDKVKTTVSGVVVHDVVGGKKKKVPGKERKDLPRYYSLLPSPSKVRRSVG